MTFGYADLRSNGHSVVIPFPAIRLPRKVWALLRALVNIGTFYPLRLHLMKKTVSSGRYFYNVRPLDSHIPHIPD
jgi:hypothetical protein